MWKHSGKWLGGWCLYGRNSSSLHQKTSGKTQKLKGSHFSGTVHCHMHRAFNHCLEANSSLNLMLQQSLQLHILYIIIQNRFLLPWFAYKYSTFDFQFVDSTDISLRDLSCDRFRAAWLVKQFVSQRLLSAIRTWFYFRRRCVQHKSLSNFDDTFGDFVWEIWSPTIKVSETSSCVTSSSQSIWLYTTLSLFFWFLYTTNRMNKHTFKFFSYKFL